MRSRATNILQIIIIITGVIYLALGLFLYFSPLQVIMFFAENVSENWFELVRDHELVAPLYFITRGFSAMVITAGAAMIMPLFDPLRYRGLIYYNGLLFPFLASLVFIKNGLFVLLTGGRLLSAREESIASEVGIQGAHSVVVILGALFLLIFIINLTGLLLTKRLANEGVE